MSPEERTQYELENIATILISVQEILELDIDQLKRKKYWNILKKHTERLKVLSLKERAFSGYERWAA